jgi:hypothetical protein
MDPWTSTLRAIAKSRVLSVISHMLAHQSVSQQHAMGRSTSSTMRRSSSSTCWWSLWLVISSSSLLLRQGSSFSGPTTRTRTPTAAFLPPRLSWSTRCLFASSSSSSLTTPPTTTPPTTNPPTAVLRDELVALLGELSASNATQIGRVEYLINTLEGRYTNPLTVDFFRTIAIEPSWRLILSTSQLQQQQSPPPGAESTMTRAVSPRQFRLRGLWQQGQEEEQVQSSNDIDDDQDSNGTSTSNNNKRRRRQQFLTTTARWDYSDQADGTFGCSGTFTWRAAYQMPAQSTRLDRFQSSVDPPVLRLQKGSALPTDVSAVVKLLHRSIPAELLLLGRYDDGTTTTTTTTQQQQQQHLAVDTTYVDATLKIVRYSSSITLHQLDGVRNVFVRQPPPPPPPTDAAAATATVEDPSP